METNCKRHDGENSSHFYICHPSAFLFTNYKDTTVAVKALTEYAEQTYIEDIDMTVRFHGTSLSGSLNVNSTNRMVVQRKDDVSLPNEIRMVVTGNGCLMLQVCADNLWLFLMVNIHAILFNQQRPIVSEESSTESNSIRSKNFLENTK